MTDPVVNPGHPLGQYCTHMAMAPYLTDLVTTGLLTFGPGVTVTSNDPKYPGISIYKFDSGSPSDRYIHFPDSVNGVYDELTCLVLYARDESNVADMIGNYRTNNAGEFLMRDRQPEGIMVTSVGVAPRPNGGAGQANDGEFKNYVLRYDGAEFMVARWDVNPNPATTSITGQIVIPADKPIGLGYNSGSARGQLHTQQYAMVFNRYLSNADIDSLIEDPEQMFGGAPVSKSNPLLFGQDF